MPRRLHCAEHGKTSTLRGVRCCQALDAGYGVTRQKVGDPLSSPLSNNANLFTLHTAQVGVAYTLDVFGGTRRQVEGLKAQADWQRFQLEAAYLTLTSNVVASAVQEAGLRGQIAATRQIIDIQTKSLELLQRQLALGQVAEADIVRRRRRWRKRRPHCLPLKSNWRNSATCWHALSAVSRAKQFPPSLNSPPCNCRGSCR